MSICCSHPVISRLLITSWYPVLPYVLAGFSLSINTDMCYEFACISFAVVLVRVDPRQFCRVLVLSCCSLHVIFSKGCFMLLWLGWIEWLRCYVRWRWRSVAVVLLLPVMAAMVVELLARGHVPLPLVLVHELMSQLVLGDSSRY